MFRKFVTLAPWAVLVFIACAMLSPIRYRPTVTTYGSIEHMAAFAVLGLLFSLAYPRQMALVCLIVLGSAVLLELAQLLTPDRHGQIRDALEKMAGGIMGVAAGRIIHFGKSRRGPDDPPEICETGGTRISGSPRSFQR